MHKSKIVLYINHPTYKIQLSLKPQNSGKASLTGIHRWVFRIAYPILFNRINSVDTGE